MKQQKRSEANLRGFGNCKIITRKDYNNLFRVFRNEEMSQREVVRRLSHLSAFALPCITLLTLKEANMRASKINFYINDLEDNFIIQ